VILITGGNGQVGSALATLLSLDGIEVIVSSRAPRSSDQIKWELNEEIVIDKQLKIDGVIHCAFDAENQDTNLNGALTIGSYAKNHTIPLLNISSVLAEFPIITYGHTKRNIEDEIRKLGGYNLRIGVVTASPPISSLKVLSKISEKLRILPFPGASTLVYETPIEMLKKKVVEYLFDPKRMVHKDSYVVMQERTCFGQLIRQSSNDKKIIVVSLPIELFLKFLWLPARFSKKVKRIRQSFAGNSLLKKSSVPEQGWGH